MEASQQGVLDTNSKGEIQFAPFPQLPQMLDSIEGFSHLWVLFIFHHNWQKWKPLVHPPRSPRKVGVWASRSPYRPNSLGMSAVRILELRKESLLVQSHDILDGTPIVDIKPYLAYADSFPEAKLGWLEPLLQNEFEIVWDEKILHLAHWLEARGGPPLFSIVQQQLRYHPTDHKRKRVHQQNDFWVLSVKTWRVSFRFLKEPKSIFIFDLNTGYSANDLCKENIKMDPYGDKLLHLEFLSLNQNF